MQQSVHNEFTNREKFKHKKQFSCFLRCCSVLCTTTLKPTHDTDATQNTRPQRHILNFVEMKGCWSKASRDVGLVILVTARDSKSSIICSEHRHSQIQTMWCASDCTSAPWALKQS